MKKLLSLILITTVCITSIQAQTYAENIKKAADLFTQKQYKAAAEAYSYAFWQNGSKGQQDDRIQASLAYAQLQSADSVLFMLNRIATRVKYDDIHFVEKEPSFSFMQNDNRWKSLCDLIRKNGEKINWTLRRELEQILKDDQMVRGDNNTSGLSQEVMDSLNLVKIEAILAKYGWLGADVVGSQGNSAIFLVLQHSNLATQLKYLPMLREAVKNKNAKPSDLALMEDRSNMWQGKKQVYGSQLRKLNDDKWFVHAIEDPENVDKRRAAIGLRPMSEYVKSFGLTWDVAEHIKAQQEVKKD